MYKYYGYYAKKSLCNAKIMQLLEEKTNRKKDKQYM